MPRRDETDDARTPARRLPREVRAGRAPTPSNETPGAGGGVADDVGADVRDPGARGFDPTGLDLARLIAEAASHALPPAKQRKPRQPKPGRAGASPRERSDPTALGDALGELIADQGWSTEVSVHALLGRWRSIVGDAVADHSHPESFTAGIVTVRTDSTAWASQLRLMIPMLLAKINAAVGDGTVKRIAVKGPDAPSWKHGIRTVKGWGGPGDTYG